MSHRRQVQLDCHLSTQTKYTFWLKSPLQSKLLRNQQKKFQVLPWTGFPKRTSRSYRQCGSPGQLATLLSHWTFPGPEPPRSASDFLGHGFGLSNQQDSSGGLSSCSAQPLPVTRQPAPCFSSHDDGYNLSGKLGIFLATSWFLSKFNFAPQHQQSSVQRAASVFMATHHNEGSVFLRCPGWAWSLEVADGSSGKRSRSWKTRVIWLQSWREA